MMHAYEAATIEEWRRWRPHEDPTLLSRLFDKDDAYRILVQIAFEAGRNWQHEHPWTPIDHPYYV